MHGGILGIWGTQAEVCVYMMGLEPEKLIVLEFQHLRYEGLEVLAKALGPIGMVRFVQSFDLGRGDYTKERSQWLSESLDEIFKEINAVE